MSAHAPDKENTLEFWKEKYEELNEQYDEYQKHSQELETELEIQLKHSDEKIKDLQMRNNRLLIENDTFKAKLNELNASSHRQISHLQEESAKLKSVKDEMQRYIRELEQKNDDLERNYRCAMFSLDEFESKLEHAVERNALLESELDEKNQLAETVQRLRDEARDLKQELAVRACLNQQKLNKSTDIVINNINDTDEISSVNNSINKMDTSEPLLIQQQAINPPLNTILNELNLQQQIQHNSQTISTNGDISKQKLINSTSLINNNNTTITNGNQQTTPTLTHVITPNGYNGHQNNFYQNLGTRKGSQLEQQCPVRPEVRVKALNYVGDALRKVTAMESRLVANRSLMKESNRDRRSATISSLESANFNNVVNMHHGHTNGNIGVVMQNSSVKNTNPASNTNSNNKTKPHNIVDVY